MASDKTAVKPNKTLITKSNAQLSFLVEFQVLDTFFPVTMPLLLIPLLVSLTFVAKKGANISTQKENYFTKICLSRRAYRVRHLTLANVKELGMSISYASPQASLFEPKESPAPRTCYLALNLLYMYE
jgi:uncharacterized membrane protein